VSPRSRSAQKQRVRLGGGGQRCLTRGTRTTSSLGRWELVWNPATTATACSGRLRAAPGSLGHADGGVLALRTYVHTTGLEDTGFIDAALAGDVLVDGEDHSIELLERKKVVDI
jgi:hypothetical protein